MKIRKQDIRKWGRQVVSYILTITLLLGLIPQSAYATELPEPPTEQTYTVDGFSITYKESSSWGTYVNAEVTIENHSDFAKSLWQLTFDYNGEFDSIWNADIVSNENGKVVVAGKTYNSTIEVGQSVTFGFMAHGIDVKPELPREITFVGGDNSYEDDSQDEEPSLENPWPGLNYALFSSGEEGLSLYTSQTSIEGSVHTNQDFYYQGGTLLVDGCLEAAKSIILKTSDMKDSQSIKAKREKAPRIEMPDITEQVSTYARDNGIVYEGNADFGKEEIHIQPPIYGKGEMTFHSTTFEGQGIVYAKNSITVNAGEVMTPEDTRVFLASENGDITLNGTNMTLNAVLYAPNGCVYINTGEFQLNGRIIAKKVVFQGTKLGITTSPQDLDLISFVYPEDVQPVVGIQAEPTYVRDENGQAHVTIENLSSIQDESIITEVDYQIYHDQNMDGVFGEEECVDTISSREKTVPFVVNTVGNYKVIQRIILTDGTLLVTEDSQCGYFEVINQQPEISLKVEKEAKADILILQNGLDDTQKKAIDTLQSQLEEEGEASGVKVSVAQKDIVEEVKSFDWKVFDHKGYDTLENHVIESEDTFSFTSYEEDPLKDFVYSETGLGKNQIISFTLHQNADTEEMVEGSGMIFGASVEDTEHPENYNNHTYKVIDEVMTWEEARKRCEAEGGYLATVVSERENTYIQESVLPESRSFAYMIGGRRDTKDTRLWKWITGEDFYWTQWDDGEPNYLGGGEDYLMMYGNRLPLGVWNDTSKTYTAPILCEWDGPHMSGYVVLLTDEGMKLIALSDVDMDNVRNGSYAKLENAGTLLGTFPYDKSVTEHKIEIERTSNKVTIVDNEEIVVEDFSLEVELEGTGIAPIVSYQRGNTENSQCVSIGDIEVREEAARAVREAVQNHKWTPGATRYVIHASEAETEEYSLDTATADLIQCLLEKEICFVGKGQSNVMAFHRIQAAVDGKIATTEDEIFEYISECIKKQDKKAHYITPEDTISYDTQYTDKENDPMLCQEWSYDYQKDTGEIETIVKEEPITKFDAYGKYHIRWKVQDNPVGENDALGVYRLWSKELDVKTDIIVHHKPEASLKVYKERKDKAYELRVTAKGVDKDSEDALKEYYAYKEIDDDSWTEGKIPEKVENGKLYLVKYQVEDKEHTMSAPAVAIVDTSMRTMVDATGDKEEPKVVLQVSSNKVKLNDVVQITAYASDNYGVKDFAVSINGKILMTHSGVLQYSCYENGTLEVVASAEDFNDNKTVVKEEIVVAKADPTVEDNPTEDTPTSQLSEEEIEQLLNAKNKAVEWLKSQADENGSWSTDGLMNTTCDALAVLRIANEAMDSNAYDAWNEKNKTKMNIDEQCHSLMGNPNEEERLCIWEQQNEDGGFGLTPSYTSDLYDTLLVLRAELYMQKLGFSSINSESLTSAINYIEAHKNEDGGFGYNNKDATRATLFTEYICIVMQLNYYDTTNKSVVDYCDRNYKAEFSEKKFLSQAMLARTKVQIEQATYTRSVMSELLSTQKEDGSIYESVEDTMLFIVLLDEMTQGGE